MASAAEVTNQLHVFHNPFSSATKQPKIPDGKINESLGFSTQLVREIQNPEGFDVIHILLYAGMNAGAYVTEHDGTSGAGAVNVGQVLGFTGSGSVDFSSYNPATMATFNVDNTDRYGMWRTVSHGMQIKLLNPRERDDGWWEAIRITPDHANTDWYLTTANNDTLASLTSIDNLTVSPSGLLRELDGMPGRLIQQNIVNEKTYNTGLLRDLHRVQFELHGKKDYHDFIQMRRRILVPAGDIDASAGDIVRIQAGRDSMYDIINKYTDQSYDMIYLRLYCRSNDPSNPVQNGSRFHINVTANQEINFNSTEREARFMTSTGTIGADNMSMHSQVRRNQRTSANVVPPV